MVKKDTSSIEKHPVGIFQNPVAGPEDWVSAFLLAGQQFGSFLNPLVLTLGASS
jgi:hypothetical protein